jgi:hypothetical protein
MVKRVLLSYNERNKVVTIPDDVDNDLHFLRMEFLRIFDITDDVTLLVVFQKFDEEWDSFVDLEESDVLQTKDKIRAVVTYKVLNNPPVQSTASSVISTGDDEDIFTCSQVAAEVSTCPSTPSSSLNGISDTEDFPHAKRRKIEKPKEEPLIHPFPLPKNHRPDVEIALKTKQMTNETRKCFLTQVAGAIYTYKKYPTVAELESVSKQIIEIYPFLGYKNLKTGSIEVVSPNFYFQQIVF